MCFACKLSWQQPSLWHPREQQGAQSHPRKASDYLGPGPPPTLQQQQRDVPKESGREEGGAYALISA